VAVLAITLHRHSGNEGLNCAVGLSGTPITGAANLSLLPSSVIASDDRSEATFSSLRSSNLGVAVGLGSQVIVIVIVVAYLLSLQKVARIVFDILQKVVILWFDNMKKVAIC